MIQNIQNTLKIIIEDEKNDITKSQELINIINQLNYKSKDGLFRTEIISSDLIQENLNIEEYCIFDLSLYLTYIVKYLSLDIEIMTNEQFLEYGICWTLQYIFMGIQNPNNISLLQFVMINQKEMKVEIKNYTIYNNLLKSAKEFIDTIILTNNLCNITQDLKDKIINNYETNVLITFQQEVTINVFENQIKTKIKQIGFEKIIV